MSSDDAAIAPASGEKPSCAARCSGKWAQFKRYMYKPETGQVMDRLPFEWRTLSALTYSYSHTHTDGCSVISTVQVSEYLCSDSSSRPVPDV